MLNRNDLIKKFELTTQQEIINHRNSLNTVLKELRDISKRLDDLEKIVDVNQAKNDSDLQKCKSNFNVLFGITDETDKNLKKHISDQDIQNTKTRNILNVYDSRVENLQKNHSDLNSKISFTQSLFDNHKSDMEAKCSYIQQSSISQSVSLMDLIDKAKQEILNYPSEALKVKSELEDKIGSHAVDVLGLLKEIRLNGKELQYIQKQIENIYTLLGRIKK